MIIPHQTIKSGDNLYRNIAAASILAKEYHDEYVKKLCELNPDLKKYDWVPMEFDDSGQESGIIEIKESFALVD